MQSVTIICTNRGQHSPVSVRFVMVDMALTGDPPLVMARARGQWWRPVPTGRTVEMPCPRDGCQQHVRIRRQSLGRSARAAIAAGRESIDMSRWPT